MDNLINSFKYNALDHKWYARNYLTENNWSLDRLLKSNPHGIKIESLHIDKSKKTILEIIMLKIALSSFRYYYLYYDNITSDRSLKAVTSMCSSSLNTIDVDSDDKEVFYLSHVFNKILESSRKLLKCYDCGTNARAVFLKLIQVGRGESDVNISYKEQERMQKEYLLNKIDPLTPLKACFKKLSTDDGKNLVVIMSISVETLGHVWVIEKRYFEDRIRYHQYQSALNSHMLIDFIESMDYGADPMKSLNIDYFFKELTSLITFKEAWTEKQYKLFVKLFAFLPKNVKNPEMGFSWTWADY